MTTNAVSLTKRESEIAKLFAWGASKKDVANHLFVSERTVENHARNIYDKTRCEKVNELSAWWFCTNFNISFDLSPLKQRIISIFLLMIIIPQMADNGDDIVRVFRVKTMKTCRTSRTRRNENDCEFEFLT
jgi:DNA-binding CsgD family transcriptional regulator